MKYTGAVSWRYIIKATYNIANIHRAACPFPETHIRTYVPEACVQERDK